MATDPEWANSDTKVCERCKVKRFASAEMFPNKGDVCNLCLHPNIARKRRATFKSSMSISPFD